MKSLNTFLPRMRTLDEAYAAILELDPQTCISKNYIRKLALTGQIPVKMSGKKRMLNFDGLLAFLRDNPVAGKSEPAEQIGEIRKVQL